MTTVNPFTYSRADLSYLVNGAPVDAAYQKAGCEAIIQQSKFALNDAALRLQQGTLELDEFYAIAKEQIKLGEMASHALAHGGWDEVSPASWKACEERVAARFEAIRTIVEDVARGRYGTVGVPTQPLSGRVLQYVGNEINQMRGSYENERVAAGKESGHDWAERILGAVDSCEDCINWAGLGRIPIDEMMDNYPINASVCGKGGNCHCVIITGRD